MVSKNEINNTNTEISSISTVQNPYLLNKKVKEDIGIKSQKRKAFGKLLISAFSKSFLLGVFVSNFGRRKYKNASDAIINFRARHPKNQNNLCLPRAFYAAKTSKKFKESGVLFIGVFLPTKSMHAWIIEDGVQPDPYDDVWINFQPVTAFYYNEKALK